MKILVTAGNTQTPIDDVRVITNIFTGRTGGLIAAAAFTRGHAVTLLTSHPDAIVRPETSDGAPSSTWEVYPYQTFDDLQHLLERLIVSGQFDAVIHSAAVSDYRLAGTYTPAPGTRFDATAGYWHTTMGSGATEPAPALVNVSAGKVKSNHPELWMRMVPTPKLVDQFRPAWGFNGVLVKFKLEVGPSELELLQIAEASRVHSQADLMVANTLTGMKQVAYLGPLLGQYERIDRPELPVRLLQAVEDLVQSRVAPDTKAGQG